VDRKDPIREAFDLLVRERPVEPPAEFREALFRRLAEQTRPERSAALAQLPVRRPWTPNRRQMAASAAAAAVLAFVVAMASVLIVSRPESALAVIRDAQTKLDEVPPFQASIVFDMNPEGATTGFPSEGTGAPKGATATVEMSYGGTTSYRQEIVSEEGILPTSGLPGVGSFSVWDGVRIGMYSSNDNHFTSSPSRSDFEPLREFSWNAPYPDWVDICRRTGAEVLPDDDVAGRTARHVRCLDWKGGTWELWVDRETGVVLKVLGALGNDDFHPFATTSRGGFEVTAIDYSPKFAPDTFTVKAPPGATDVSQNAPVPPQSATSAPEVQDDPYSHVTLTQGEVASDWHGTLLDGGTIDLQGLRGRPALILLFADWCPLGDPACDVLPQFQEIYHRWKGRASFVWVDFDGTESEARRIVDANGYTFPVTVDATAADAWGVDVFPLWVLLDAEGRTVDVRTRPQSVDQLEDFLAQAF
jgi:thiol-disulfide isomerase/thioredoxin